MKRRFFLWLLLFIFAALPLQNVGAEELYKIAVLL